MTKPWWTSASNSTNSSILKCITRPQKRTYITKVKKKEMFSPFLFWISNSSWNVVVSLWAAYGRRTEITTTNVEYTHRKQSDYKNAFVHYLSWLISDCWFIVSEHTVDHKCSREKRNKAAVLGTNPEPGCFDTRHYIRYAEEMLCILLLINTEHG